MLRHILAYLWMLSLYSVTAVAALFDVLPVRPELLEVRNVVVHATTYAVQGLLFAWAVDQPRHRVRFDRRTWQIMLAAIAMMGIGQEILQTVLRRRVYPINSVFDVVVDVSGAALGLLLYTRLRRPGGLFNSER